MIPTFDLQIYPPSGRKGWVWSIKMITRGGEEGGRRSVQVYGIHVIMAYPSFSSFLRCLNMSICLSGLYE